MRVYKVIYMLLLSIVTLIFGIAETLSGIFKININYIPLDVFGGFALIVISLIFLRGCILDDEAYLFVGSMLLAIFGLLYVLVVLSNAMDSLISENGYSFAIRPEILLLPFSVLGVLSIRLEDNLKDKTEKLWGRIK